MDEEVDTPMKNFGSTARLGNKMADDSPKSIKSAKKHIISRNVVSKHVTKENLTMTRLENHVNINVNTSQLSSKSSR